MPHRRLRETLAANPEAAATEEEQEAKAKEKAAERRKAAHELAAERIKAELLAKSHSESKIDLDDTDGLDPEAEFQEWRLRELQRIKRTKDEEKEREEEKAEVERRRNMPQAQRDREDMERAKKQLEEKKANKKDIGFMQKYYHKGAFFQVSRLVLHAILMRRSSYSHLLSSSQDMDILKRDYSGPTENAVDKSQLPKLMQVRDYGKASRSKWTHLSAEDTSRQKGEDARYRPQGWSERQAAKGELGGRDGDNKQGCFNCGGPHLRRDCPNPSVGPTGDSGRITGTNNAVMRGPERRWGARDDRPREDDRDADQRDRRPEERRDRPDRDRDRDESAYRYR